MIITHCNSIKVLHCVVVCGCGTILHSVFNMYIETKMINAFEYVCVHVRMFILDLSFKDYLPTNHGA